VRDCLSDHSIVPFLCGGKGGARTQDRNCVRIFGGPSGEWDGT
jgi:hypothetical protein